MSTDRAESAVVPEAPSDLDGGSTRGAITGEFVGRSPLLDRVFVDARLAQARHTACEELTYREMWRVGTKMPDGSRYAAISQRSLALRTGRNQRTVERSIRGLILKGSIALVAKARSGNSAVYRVLSYGQILLANRSADTAGGRDV